MRASYKYSISSAYYSHAKLSLGSSRYRLRGLSVRGTLARPAEPQTDLSIHIASRWLAFDQLRIHHYRHHARENVTVPYNTIPHHTINNTRYPNIPYNTLPYNTTPYCVNTRISPTIPHQSSPLHSHSATSLTSLPVLPVLPYPSSTTDTTSPY